MKSIITIEGTGKDLKINLTFDPPRLTAKEKKLPAFLAAMGCMELLCFEAERVTSAKVFSGDKEVFRVPEQELNP